MKNEYTTPEVIEIGEAQEVILGEKIDFDLDEQQPARKVAPDSDLD